MNDYKTALKNKQLIVIIEKILSSYPISFINLERLRKEVDNLMESFWIKDDEGKYLLVNRQFASSLNLTPQQIEGKPVDKFIPAYMLNFNKALEEYIQESGSVFSVEGFPLSGSSAWENMQVIEIPVPGPEGNLKAIIGIIQEINKEDDGVNLSSSLQLFQNLLSNYILLNDKNIIIDASEEFCEIFSLIAREVIGKKYKANISGIPVIISTLIDDFIQSNKVKQSVKVNIPGYTDYDFELHFIKGRNEEKLVLVDKNNFKNDHIKQEPDIQSYDLLVQKTPEPVFIFDKEDLRFLQVNNLALDLYGYRRDEFLQLDLTDLYAPDDIQKLSEISEENQNRANPKPHRQKRKDGKNIFVEINKTLINYNNKPAYLNTIRDVTEKLNLAKESQQFKDILNSSGDLIFLTDKEGFVLTINDSVIDKLGLSSSDAAGSSFTSLLIDEDRAKINSSVFQSGIKEKLTFEVSLKKTGNEFIKVKLTASPVFDFNGDVESFNIICSPVKEILEIVKEIIKEIPIETSSANVPSAIPEINFMSGVFHDLLTPINVILGFVQDLTENIEKPTPEQKESLEIISQNRENLIVLLNQVIECVQVEKGEAKLKYEKIKVINIIEELKDEIESKNIGELAFGKISSSLEIITDKEKLLHFCSLIVNLVAKITGQNKLYVSVEQEGKDYFSIGIKDNYNNASAVFSEKLIKIFSVDLKDIKVPGVPSISVRLFQNLLKLVQGEFNISLCKIIFPVNLKENIEEKIIRDENFDERDEQIFEVSESENTKPEKDKSIKDADERQKQSTINLSQLRCLYIEDQLDSQMLFSMQMKDFKEIDFAISLEQAIPILNTKKFDFIIMDINLQGDYNGLDILKVLRTMPAYENTPVIAVTAYLIPIDREIYIQAGFTDFISKPLLRENLLNTLERTLELQL